ncbi:MAG TPA: AAA family ATPase [Candidatus Lokiarchaeia archaeon]|nr:AAA family ATPase [Candidatus Lokiarchaeia archaeon]
MDFEDELKRGILNDHVFKRNGESTLDRTYIPEEIRHRDAALNKIASDFKAVFKEDRGINIALRGQGGFGKTAVARYTQKKLVKVAADLSITFDTRYYTCFQYRTFGAMMREYLPANYFISGKGFSISELIAYLIQNLQRDNKKLLFIIDEIQNLKPDEIVRILSINEEFKIPGETKEYFSTILIARTGDWEAIFSAEPRIVQRLQSIIDLPKYTFEQLFDIFAYRRDLAFNEGVLSDDNVEVIAEMSELSGNVYYGIELMHHAGKMASQLDAPEILPEMIRNAAQYVSTEFRDPILKDLKQHELLALLAIARVLEEKSKQNIQYATTDEAFAEYQIVCEEQQACIEDSHVISVFRKYIQKLNQSHLIHERVHNLQNRGRRAEINIPDFSAELVCQKVLEILNNAK